MLFHIFDKKSTMRTLFFLVQMEVVKMFIKMSATEILFATSWHFAWIFFWLFTFMSNLNVPLKISVFFGTKRTNFFLFILMNHLYVMHQPMVWWLVVVDLNGLTEVEGFVILELIL